MSTQNKIALVTGGSRGLGRDMAINLAKKGIDVVITYNSNQQAAGRVVAEIENSGRKASALPLDAADQSGYTDFFNNKLQPQLEKSFGTTKFDFLINNAGTGHFAPFTTKTVVSQVDELINIHFKAGYFFTQQALDH